MAARQDQSLVIALIVFVILAVIGLAWGYLMLKSASDAGKELADVEQRFKQEQDAKRNMQQENETYRGYMGLGELDNFDTVQGTFQEDMQRFGPTFEESRQNYRDILVYIFEENQKIAQREADAKEQLRQLKERLLAVEEEKEKQVKQFETQMQEAEADAARQRNSFAQDRAELEGKKQELLQSKEGQKMYYEGQLADKDATIQKLTDQLAISDRAKEKLLSERATASESFEVPDGRVTWVNQDGTVWINLGTADALRRQITFSVYDADLEDPAKAEKKGSIEVTRVLGDRMSEARITEDTSINPILSGDYVYSQVWHPGKTLRFALTGFIDIDGDGVSDLKKARDLIELNGGVVDAYLDEEGVQHGEMTVNTRYLVLGEFPESALKAPIRQGWSEMTEDADKKGVETILLPEFLNQMGYHPEERTVRLGTGARPGDFTATSEQDNPRTRTQQFRPRTPYQPPSRVRY